jgi:hypothetical protein
MQHWQEQQNATGDGDALRKHRRILKRAVKDEDNL